MEGVFKSSKYIDRFFKTFNLNTWRLHSLGGHESPNNVLKKSKPRMRAYHEGIPLLRGYEQYYHVEKDYKERKI
jgi:hypothetical protein